MEQMNIIHFPPTAKKGRSAPADLPHLTNVYPVRMSSVMMVRKTMVAGNMDRYDYGLL